MPWALEQHGHSVAQGRADLFAILDRIDKSRAGKNRRLGGENRSLIVNRSIGVPATEKAVPTSVRVND